jgi:hypothetical protein
VLGYCAFMLEVREEEGSEGAEEQAYMHAAPWAWGRDVSDV